MHVLVFLPRWGFGGGCKPRGLFIIHEVGREMAKWAAADGNLCLLCMCEREEEREISEYTTVGMHQEQLS